MGNIQKKGITARGSLAKIIFSNIETLRCKISGKLLVSYTEKNYRINKITCNSIGFIIEALTFKYFYT